MKLYMLTQHDNNSYDTYDSCIVAAESADAARFIHPSGESNYRVLIEGKWLPTYHKDPNIPYLYGEWAYGPESVEAEYIGEAKEGTEAGVILASFNAG